MQWERASDIGTGIGFITAAIIIAICFPIMVYSQLSIEYWAVVAVIAASAGLGVGIAIPSWLFYIINKPPNLCPKCKNQQ